MIHPALVIKESQQKGRGVFTLADLSANVIIEIAPVIVMTLEERFLLDQTLLHDYIFEWGHQKNKCCMALGYVPMYNHSYQSNCEYFMDFDTDTIEVRTVKNIRTGEEVTINYNGNWNDPAKLWFDAK